MNFELIQIRMNSSSFQQHSAIISISTAQHALTGASPALTLAVARSMRHGLSLRVSLRVLYSMDQVRRVAQRAQ